MKEKLIYAFVLIGSAGFLYAGWRMAQDSRNVKRYHQTVDQVLGLIGTAVDQPLPDMKGLRDAWLRPLRVSLKKDGVEVASQGANPSRLDDDLTISCSTGVHARVVCVKYRYKSHVYTESHYYD